jgi:hypothetical protein
VTAIVKQHVPIELPAGTYSDKEINLLGHCWADAGQISAKKTALALHLYELKKELDNGDPNATNGGGGKAVTRFWAAFDAGHLPLSGESGRTSVKTALQAAAWLAERELAKGLASSLHTLAPSTIVEISNLSGDAQALAFKAIESSSFIGTNAVRLLARITENDTLARLDQWVTTNKAKTLTPASIEKVRAEVAAEKAPTEPPAPEPPAPPLSDADFKARVEASRKVAADTKPSRSAAPTGAAKGVAQQLRESAAAEEAELKDWHKKYANALGAAVEGLRGLRRTLNTIATVKGTIYLSELRELDTPLGFNYVANDIEELKACRDLLLEIVETATSHEPPQTLDFETVNVEVV